MRMVMRDQRGMPGSCCPLWIAAGTPQNGRHRPKRFLPGLSPIGSGVRDGVLSWVCRAWHADFTNTIAQGLVMNGSHKARLLFCVIAVVAAVLTAPAAASAAPGDALYSRLNNLCVDIAGGDYQPGAAVITWTCHGRANQSWYWDGDQIRSDLNNLCLDIAGGSYAPGAGIITWPCHGRANQSWYWYGDQIRSTLHDMCLDIEGGAYERGARLITWPCHGNANQRWY
jgi:hypothetical protein